MKLFQYWDTGDPPAEVAEWIEGFRLMNPEMDHRLYDRDSAAWFIGKHVGDRERRAFEACAVPALQSDYFRYCAIWAKAGVYIDADFQCLAPLFGLLERAPHALTFVWDHHLVASLLMARRRHDAFLRACLDLSTANVEARWGRNSYMAAGPGVTNAVRLLADPSAAEDVAKGFDNVFGRNWRFPELIARAVATIEVTPELVASFQAYTTMRISKAAAWIAAPEPAYKSSGVHWLHWRGPIYRDVAPTKPG